MFKIKNQIFFKKPDNSVNLKINDTETEIPNKESQISLRKRSTKENFKIPLREDHGEIIKAIENWNAKEILSVNSFKQINEYEVFNVNLLETLNFNLSPNFWKSLNDCNYLHYAALFRATQTIQAFLSDKFSFQINSVTKHNTIIPRWTQNLAILEGVTALHISASVGDFYTVQYLLANGANINSLDKKSRSALHYAVFSNIETCILLTKDENKDYQHKDEEENSPLEYAKLSNNSQIIDYVEHLVNKESTFWVPQHFCQLECERITPKKANLTQCECGQNIYDHYSVFDRYDLYGKEFVEIPTNCYGDIEFSNLYKSRPYIRFSKKTEFKFLFQLLIDQWKIENPSLIISAYGSEFEGHAIKEILKKGILKSAGNEGTFVWIITNGISSNLIQVISEAVRDFTDAYGEDQIYAISITPWGACNFSDFLCSRNYQGNHLAEFQGNVLEKFHTDVLDQNHSHYLFVDIPREDNQNESYIKFRLEFENAVSDLHSYLETDKRTATKVPICGILISGTREDLRLLHGSLVKNCKPSVIIKDSGGVANLISFLLDEISEKNRKKRTIEEVMNKEKLKSLMTEVWNVTSEFEEEIILIKEIIENRHLIEIFSLKEDMKNELDKKILSSLLSQDQNQDDAYNQLNIPQLNISISINRHDVAREKIFTEGKKWKTEDLMPLASKCVSDNKVEFIKIFIEKGFFLAKIITVEYLEYLYTSDVFNGYKSLRILHQVLRLTKFKKSNNRVSLYDIGAVLKYMLGDFYFPLYLKSSFQSTLNENLELTRPYRELFIWSLLTQRMELAELLWTLETESIAAALFAANLLRCMINLTDVISDREDLDKWAGIFENKAEGVVEECFKENPEYTRENLVRVLEYYGETTYLELAADGNSIKFIAHRSCQELLDFVWRNTLDSTTKSFQFIYYLFLGMTCPLILPWVVQYKQKFYQPINENDKGETLNENEKNSMLIGEIDDSTLFERNINSPKTFKFSSFHLKMYFKKIFDFYATPVIKFSYTIFFYVIFVFYFAFMNLTAFHVQNLKTSYVWTYILLIIWTVSLGLEEIRQAFGSGISFKAYISDLWNIIDILSQFFFIFGTFAIGMTMCDPIVKYILFSLFDITPMLAISITLFRFSKFMYGFSLFMFSVRILQYFSINIHMGPIIVMIQNMLSNDLGPFMAILMTVLISYGILLWSINFEVKDELTLSDLPIVLYEMFRTIYFQLFGDLRIEILRNESQYTQCTTSQLMCPDVWGIWLGPVLAAIYMVISNALMLNVLIAIFSNTYEIIQSSATQYWTMERYNLMRQSSSRPPVAPPLLIIWQIYFVFATLFSFKIEQTNPFKTSYGDVPFKEKQLIQWEHLRAIDYMRSQDDASKNSRKQTTLVVNRGAPSIGSFGSMKKDLETLRTEIRENVKEKLVFVESRLQRLEAIDINVNAILDLLRNLDFTQLFENNKEEIRKDNSKTSTDPVAKVSSSITQPDMSGKISKLWHCEIVNHVILRFVPIICLHSLSKVEFISENDNDEQPQNWLKDNANKSVMIPVNPHQTLNKIGKQLLPFWGVNNCIHIIISRWKRDVRGNIIKLFNKPVLQVLGITQKTFTEIPFFFVRHNSSCLLESCSMDLLKGIIKHYINERSAKNTDRNSMKENDISALNAATVYEIFRGFIYDFRNTDNSWIETAAFNIHQIYNCEFSNEFIKVLEHHQLEKMMWIDVIKENWSNPSCVTLLGELSKYHNSDF